jgi:hypothetical protein
MVFLLRNMLLKVYDKTAFANFKQNLDGILSKQPKLHWKIHTSLWMLKISRKKSPNLKSRDFCHKCVISKKKARTLEKKTIHKGMDLKIYSKSIAGILKFYFIPPRECLSLQYGTY